jgi:hypothetical protein
MIQAISLMKHMAVKKYYVFALFFGCQPLTIANAQRPVDFWHIRGKHHACGYVVWALASKVVEMLVLKGGWTVVAIFVGQFNSMSKMPETDIRNELLRVRQGRTRATLKMQIEEKLKVVFAKTVECKVYFSMHALTVLLT